MAKLGLLRTINPDNMTPTMLMNTVDEELAKIQVRSRNLYRINLNGLLGVRNSINQLMMDGDSEMQRSSVIHKSGDKQLKHRAF
jgi:predicted glycosyltransferase